MTPAPPRLALWIITRATRARDRDEVIGDIIEEFARLAVVEPRAARSWCWRQALRALRPGAGVAPRTTATPHGGQSMFRGFAAEVRYSARLLRSQPLLSLVAMTSLVIGLGLNVLLFTIAGAVLYRPLPVDDPGSLVVLGLQRPANVAHNFSYPAYQRLAQDSAAFDAVVAYASRDGGLTFSGDTITRTGEIVSGNFFTSLGVPMVEGRGLSIHDDVRSAPPAVVISEPLWRERYGAAPIAGQTLVLNNTAFTIVGVASTRFHGMFTGSRADFWVTTAHSPVIGGRDLLAEPRASWLWVLGRLRAGATADTVRAELDPRLAAHLSTLGAPPQPLVTSPGARGSDMMSERYETRLQILMAAGAFVLLVACVNVANLQLARNAARRRELAVRAALGAPRALIARLLMIDAVLLAVPAGIVALAVAAAGRGPALSLITTFGRPVDLAAPIDAAVWAAAAALVLASAIFVGVIAAWQGTRTVAGTLAAGGRGGTEARQRLQRGLVTVQFALSMTLLVGAALLVRSATNLRSIDLGFTSSVVMIEALPGDAQITGAQAVRYLQEAADRAAAVPGVEATAVAHVMPLDFGGSRTSVAVPGYDAAEGEDLELNFLRVSPGYFETMRIPVLRGRAFDSTDTADAAPRVIVNQTMAQRYWKDGDAVGRAIDVGDGPAEVIGIVADAHYRMVRERARPSFYVPLAQLPFSRGVIHARTAGDPAALVETLRREVAAVNPRVPIARAVSLEAQRRLNIAEDRMAEAIGVTLGVSALLLAAAGLYGTMAFAVRRRTREIGVRMALGARATDVRALVLRQGMTLVAAGSILGALGAGGVGRLLQGQLYGVRSLDPAAIAAAFGLLTVTALLAAWIPARRATRVDPVIALRDA